LAAAAHVKPSLDNQELQAAGHSPRHALYNIQDGNTSFLEIMALLKNLVFSLLFLYHPTPPKSSSNNNLMGLRMI
jgi:hypothetical protein